MSTNLIAMVKCGKIMEQANLNMLFQQLIPQFDSIRLNKTRDAILFNQ